MHLFLLCCLFLCAGVPEGDDPQTLALANSMDRAFLRTAQVLLDENMPDDQEIHSDQTLLARELALCDPAWVQRHPETDTAALESAWNAAETAREQTRLRAFVGELCEKASGRLSQRQSLLEEAAATLGLPLVQQGEPEPGALLPGLAGLPAAGSALEMEITDDYYQETVCPGFAPGTLLPSGSLINPVPGAWVSAGTWAYPGGGLHLGLDLAAELYTEVTAPASGLVVYQSAGQPADSGYPGNVSGYPAGAGNSILLLCPVEDRVYSVAFYHLSDIHYVRPGQSVQQGDVIALSGNAGNSTGPHTHVEICELFMDLSEAAAWFLATSDFSFGTGWNAPAACSPAACRRRPEELLAMG